MKRNPIPTEQRKKSKPKVENGFDKWQQSYTYSETINSNMCSIDFLHPITFPLTSLSAPTSGSRTMRETSPR
jgi:hypothetical protein